MSKEFKGITIAGNILTDVVKMIDCYPNIGMLSNIKQTTQSVGGCVPNTAIDLAKIDSDLPISAIGKIGDDGNGRYVLSELEKYGIDCKKVKISKENPTSYSDVMSLRSGERTFFHARGANAEFSPADIDIDALDCKILHIGYILLLDEFDKPDDEYGTVMARFLHSVQQKGIKTSVDVVSDSSADYKAKILPALKYCDYIILNEIESSNLSDLSPYYSDGKLNISNIEKTMQFMASKGVREKIIIHCKKAGFCYDVKSGDFVYAPSLNVPKSEIVGTVGAGDAFCAGSLYSIYNGFTNRHILEFAAAAAACNLFSENAIDGMKTKKEIEDMIVKYGWEELE